MRRALPTLTALAAAVLLSPSGAAACAVCFGATPGSNVAKAIGIGILTMLATVLSVLTALIVAVWRIEKRRALAEAAAPATSSPRGAV